MLIQCSCIFFFLNKIFSLYSITRWIQTAAHSTIPTKLLPTRRKPQSPRCPRVKQTLPQESSLQQVSESDPVHDFLGRESPGSHPPPPAQAAKQAAREAAKCHFLPMHHLRVSLCRLQQLDWGAGGGCRTFFLPGSSSGLQDFELSCLQRGLSSPFPVLWNLQELRIFETFILLMNRAERGNRIRN